MKIPVPVEQSTLEEVDLKHAQTIRWAASCRCLRCHWPTGKSVVALCDFCQVQRNRRLSATRLPK